VNGTDGQKTLSPNERPSVFHVRDENLPNMSSDWLIRNACARFGSISVLLHQLARTSAQGSGDGGGGRLIRKLIYVCLSGRFLARRISRMCKFVYCRTDNRTNKSVSMGVCWLWEAVGAPGCLGGCSPFLWHARAHFHFT